MVFDDVAFDSSAMSIHPTGKGRLCLVDGEASVTVNVPGWQWDLKGERWAVIQFREAFEAGDDHRAQRLLLDELSTEESVF